MVDDYNVKEEIPDVKKIPSKRIYFDEIANWGSPKTDSVKSLEGMKAEVKEEIKAELKAELRVEMGMESKVTVLRTISYEDAQNEVEELINTATEPIYYSDIVEQLQIDLEQVIKVVDKLQSEGKIKEYDDK